MFASMFKDLRFRLRSLFQRSRVESELAEELEAHLEYETEKYIRAGMSPEEAHRKARIALGGLEQTRQQVRDSRGTRLLENFLQDLRYGTRSLLKNKGFATVVVLTLALGIAACTAVFSLMDVVLYPRLPYADTERLVYLYTPNRIFEQIPMDGIFPTNYLFYGIKSGSHSYASMAQYELNTLKLVEKGATASIGATRGDADFFRTLGGQPLLGRTFDVRDVRPGQDSVAVISFSLWRQKFAQDPNVLSKTLTLEWPNPSRKNQGKPTQKSYRVIGVMPQGFHFPENDGTLQSNRTDIWIPLVLSPAERLESEYSSLGALARLKPAVSVDRAQSEMTVLIEHLEKGLPTSFLHNGGWYGYVKPFREALVGDARPLLRLLTGAVAFVLLISCGNAASLLLARIASRTHEIGVRATLGAGRGRLMQQMLTDALLLGISGGIVSIALSWLFLKMLLRLDPGNIPRLQQAALNSRVLLFTIVVTLLTSIITGVLPALSAARGDLVEFLKSGGNRGVVRGNHRLRSLLITAEVALVVMLLSGTSLLIRSFLKLEAVPKGFSTATLSMRLDPPNGYFSVHRGFFPKLLVQIHAIPGVEAAGATTSLPLSHNESISAFSIQDYESVKGEVIDQASLTPGYLAAMGTPMLAGRELQQNDGNVVIVNEAFVKAYFGGHNPIGKWVRSMDPNGSLAKNALTVVGVVSDVRHSSLEQPPSPTIYDRLQDPDRAFLAIRSSLPSAAMMSAARAALNRLDPTLNFSDIHTMNDRVSEAMALRRFQTVLLSVFSAMALVLALVGLYGLLAYTVRQREQEIGIRLAIGASRGNVLSLIVGHGVRLVFAGLVAGLAGAFALQHLLKSFLYGVQGTDPLTFLLVPLLLLLTALGACALPGWRAANVDPAISLRYE